MPALKYPVAYRNNRAVELSRRPAATRSNQPAANQNIKSPPPTAWDKAFRLVGGRPSLAPISVAEATVIRFKHEARLIAEAFQQGRHARGMTLAFRLASRVARGRDVRLDIALSIAETIAGLVGGNVGTGEMMLIGGWELRSYGLYASDAGSLGPYPGTAGDWRNAEMYLWNEFNTNGGPHVRGSKFTSGARYVPAGTTPVEASISGQAGQNPTAVYSEWMGLWSRSQTNDRNRHLASWRRPHTGPATPLQFEEVMQPIVLPRFARALNTRPLYSVRPGVKNEVLYNPNVRLNAPPGARPPPKLPAKQKEEGKYSVSPNASTALMMGVNALTEGLDFVDVVYKAVGGSWGISKSPQEKLLYIWENRGKFDAGVFIYEFAKQQVTDAFWGSIGQLAGKGGRAGGFATGLQTGPWDTEGSYHGFNINLQIEINRG